jgi:RimJ/RimL family protein N-acetyltransferase
VESIESLREHLWFLPWVAEEPTMTSAEVRCRKAEAHFLLRTDLPFLVFERSTGRLVGSAGLHRTDWQLPKTEVGYWLRNSATGQGYASEAVQALTRWALDILGAVRVELVTDERNHGSRAVADRCGFRLEGVLQQVMRGRDGSLRNSCIFARLGSVAGGLPAESTTPLWP